MRGQGETHVIMCRRVTLVLTQRSDHFAISPISMNKQEKEQSSAKLLKPYECKRTSKEPRSSFIPAEQQLTARTDNQEVQRPSVYPNYGRCQGKEGCPSFSVNNVPEYPRRSVLSKNEGLPFVVKRIARQARKDVSPIKEEDKWGN